MLRNPRKPSFWPPIFVISQDCKMFLIESCITWHFISVPCVPCVSLLPYDRRQKTDKVPPVCCCVLAAQTQVRAALKVNHRGLCYIISPHLTCIPTHTHHVFPSRGPSNDRLCPTWPFSLALIMLWVCACVCVCVWDIMTNRMPHGLPCFIASSQPCTTHTWRNVANTHKTKINRVATMHKPMHVHTLRREQWTAACINTHTYSLWQGLEMAQGCSQSRWSGL